MNEKTIAEKKRMESLKRLEDIARKIRGEDDWWKSSGYDVYCDVAKRLCLYGISHENIEDILHRLYWAAANEYGG